MPETKYFSKDITLTDSKTQFPAKLAYWTFGEPSSPAILLPTCYGGTLASTSTFLYDKESHPDPLFPPSKYFIIVTALLGGTESSSPSTKDITPTQYLGPKFPHTSYEDNIRLQHALCQDLGVERLFAYIGFSMGGQQAYHFSVLFPKFVENMVCLCGSARTSAHNWSFLEGPKHALIMSKDFEGGNYTAQPKMGQKAFARVYSTWALSQPWFRQECWKEAGSETLEKYLETNWSGMGDANCSLATMWTWQNGDVSKLYKEDGGDLAKALGRIEARCLIMPARTDMYFPPEDNEEEVKHLKNGELRVIETVWGHIAGGGGGSKKDTEFIISEIKKFLRI